MEVLDGARVLVAVEPADATVSEPDVVDDRRHQAELKRVQGAFDVGVPRSEVVDELAQTGVVECPRRRCRSGKPAGCGGVSAKGMEPIDDRQPRFGGDIPAGQARQLIERLGNGGVVSQKPVDLLGWPRSAVGAGGDPLALLFGGRLDSVDQTRLAEVDAFALQRLGALMDGDSRRRS